MVFTGGDKVQGVFNVSLFWDGDQPPPHVFAEFDAIPAFADTTMTQRYPQLLDIPTPDDLTIRTTNAVSSLKNMPHDQMTAFFDRHFDDLTSATYFSAPGFALFSMAIQAIPVALQKANFDRGPAALATDPAGGDKIWIEYDLAWVDPKYDATWPQELLNVVVSGRDLQQVQYADVKPTNYQSGDLGWVPYNPLFANDAQVGQPVLQSYGAETYNKMKELHAQLDPTNMFLMQTKCFQF